MSIHPSGLTAQQIAARESGRVRAERARRRKARESALIASLPPCPNCGGKVTNDDKIVLHPDDDRWDKKYVCDRCWRSVPYSKLVPEWATDAEA